MVRLSAKKKPRLSAGAKMTRIVLRTGPADARSHFCAHTFLPFAGRSRRAQPENYYSGCIGTERVQAVQGRQCRAPDRDAPLQRISGGSIIQVLRRREITMRAVRGALLIGSYVLFTSVAHAAGKCPADPFIASKAIWNWGDFRSGEVRSGVHPCGRKMTCIGGKIVSGKTVIKRSCHWD